MKPERILQFSVLFWHGDKRFLLALRTGSPQNEHACNASDDAQVVVARLLAGPGWWTHEDMLGKEEEEKEKKEDKRRARKRGREKYQDRHDDVAAGKNDLSQVVSGYCKKG